MVSAKCIFWLTFSGNLKLRNRESSVRNKRLPYTLYQVNQLFMFLPHLFYSVSQVFWE